MGRKETRVQFSKIKVSEFILLGVGISFVASAAPFFNEQCQPEQKAYDNSKSKMNKCLDHIVDEQMKSEKQDILCLQELKELNQKAAVLGKCRESGKISESLQKNDVLKSKKANRGKT